MEAWKPNDKSLDLDGLHLALWYSEMLRGRVEEITTEKPDGADEDATWTRHNRPRIVPVRSLVIVVDPEHDDDPPDGTTLVCRGEAYISGSPTKVSLFRKLL